MAYVHEWNESTPLGSEEADTIDTIIQNVKASIRERLEDLIPDWDDDGVDPKVFAEGSARITFDTNANRPANATSEGEVYFESDTGDIYVGDDSDPPEWVAIELDVDTDVVANRPATSIEIEGKLFWATDERRLYILFETAPGTWEWIPVHPLVSSEGTSYDADSPGADDSNDPDNVRSILFIRVTGTTNGTGLIDVDFDKFAGSYNPDSLDVARFITTPKTSGVANVRVQAGPSSNIVTFEVLDYTGNPITSTAVEFALLVPKETAT